MSLERIYSGSCRRVYTTETARTIGHALLNCIPRSKDCQPYDVIMTKHTIHQVA